MLNKSPVCGAWEDWFELPMSNKSSVLGYATALLWLMKSNAKSCFFSASGFGGALPPMSRRSATGAGSGAFYFFLSGDSFLSFDFLVFGWWTGGSSSELLESETTGLFFLDVFVSMCCLVFGFSFFGSSFFWGAVDLPHGPPTDEEVPW